ncbi:hypothetical protein IFT69_13255 [Pseudomonas putida]|nr:hypothetical protein [Pseudomonas putida]
MNASFFGGVVPAGSLTIYDKINNILCGKEMPSFISRSPDPSLYQSNTGALMQTYAGFYLELKEPLDPEVVLPGALSGSVYTHEEEDEQTWLINYAIPDVNGLDINDVDHPAVRKIVPTVIEDQRKIVLAHPDIAAIFEFLKKNYGDDFVTLEYGFFCWYGD